MKAWNQGVATEDFQLNACDQRDRQPATEVLLLKGVGTESKELGLKIEAWE